MDNTNLFGIERIIGDGMRTRLIFHLQSDAMVRIRQFMVNKGQLSETNYNDIPSFHLHDVDPNGKETRINVSMVYSNTMIDARKVWNILTTLTNFNRMTHEAVMETLDNASKVGN